MEWSGNWYLTYRTADGLARLALAAGIPPAAVRIGSEELGVDLFLIACRECSAARNVSGTLRVPLASGTRSVPDTLARLLTACQWRAGQGLVDRPAGRELAGEDDQLGHAETARIEGGLLLQQACQLAPGRAPRPARGRSSGAARRPAAPCGIPAGRGPFPERRGGRPSARTLRRRPAIACAAGRDAESAPAPHRARSNPGTPAAARCTASHTPGISRVGTSSKNFSVRCRLCESTHLTSTPATASNCINSSARRRTGWLVSTATNVRKVSVILRSGQWSAVSGQRSAVSGQRAAVSGQWSAVSGQQSAVSGQRAAISGQQSAGRKAGWDKPECGPARIC